MDRITENSKMIFGALFILFIVGATLIPRKNTIHLHMVEIDKQFVQAACTVNDKTETCVFERQKD